MSRLSRLKFDRFCVLNQPLVAAIKTATSGVAIALFGGIAGYSIGRIELSHLMSEQAARHVTEILRVRDEYGAKAQNTRDAVRQAAEGASEAAQALRDLAVGPSAKAQADRAQDAAARAEAAQHRVEEIFPEVEAATVKKGPKP
ncbi:hypothetical protein GCM10007242_41660 [Pigmentiphaga litoralis]|uniref:hypothetical protein n=1 Tax=Pigmentiphaga litoralis TaxID=516702 RepID=UPI001678B918|nr:hypothetical protein [Pigmentiphaga litoralis]GGX30626.1 hypothetical protein GCM10007242_41660 [Pigmentiphaga litoralis]